MQVGKCLNVHVEQNLSGCLLRHQMTQARQQVPQCVRAHLKVGTSVVDPNFFLSDPDPTFQEISDPDPDSDPDSDPDPISDPT